MFVFLLLPCLQKPGSSINYEKKSNQSHHLIKTRQLLPDQRLPPIFPVVLYNGDKRWNVATELKDLIVKMPGGLEQYLPSLNYLILDEGAYALEDLAPL